MFDNKFKCNHEAWRRVVILEQYGKLMIWALFER